MTFPAILNQFRRLNPEVSSEAGCPVMVIAAGPLPAYLVSQHARENYVRKINIASTAFHPAQRFVFIHIYASLLEDEPVL